MQAPIAASDHAGPAFVSLGDLDGDLDLDLFTVSWGGDRQNLFLNTGHGTHGW